MKRILVIFGCLALFLWGCTGAPGDQEKDRPMPTNSSRQLRLQKAESVQMLQLKFGNFRPFFRMDLNLVDERGALRPFEMPVGRKEQRRSIEVVEGDSVFHPFYVCASENTERIGRELMLLIDISGSMLSKSSDGRMTRFESAKRAAKKLILGFEDGADSMAIVAFESHKVRQRILGAPFVSTQSEAERLIDGLPMPMRKNNTGLYSATLEALQVMQSKKAADSSRRFQLVILTDGGNDVNHPQDDPDLLDGLDGLLQVEAKRREVGIEVYTIGFGEQGRVDERALRRIASHPSNYSLAPDETKLELILERIRRAMVNRLRITFFTGENDWRQLQGLTVRIRFRMPDGMLVESPEIRWSCPVLTGCAPDGVLTEPENRALVEAGLNRSEGPLIVRRLLIFGAFSAALALLWFVLPKVIWPDVKWPQLGKNATAAPKAAFSAPRLAGSKAGGKDSKEGPGRQESSDLSPRPRKPYEGTVCIEQMKS